MQEFEIENIREEHTGQFLMRAGDQKAGALHYTLFDSGRVVINHTEVAPDFQGQGLAGKLVDAAVNFAREEGFKILPVCSFAKKYMTAKRAEYADVLV